MVCHLTLGEIYYGKKGVYTSKVFSGRTGCNNGVFGDPLRGTVKECRYEKTNIEDKHVIIRVNMRNIHKK